MPLAALVAVAAAAMQPADFTREEESELLTFSYSWPAAAEAEPALRGLLHREMEAQRAQSRRWAEEDRERRREVGNEPMQHHYARGWQVAGATARLLSLTASEETFTGGAHGNLAFAVILWDRAAGEAVPAAQLLGGAALQGMTGRYCASLNAERRERRGEPVSPDDFFADCPPLAELVLAPKDADGNGRFDTLDVLIPPYVAGPYAEGAYFAEVPFTGRDLAGVPERYRDSFEAAAG